MGAAPEMHRRAQSRPIAALTLVRIFLARKPIALDRKSVV